MKNSSAYWNLSQPRQVKANKRVPLPHQCVLLLKAATSVVLPDFLTWSTFLFLFSLALAEVQMGRCVCAHLPPALLLQPPGIHRAKSAHESHKEPLLSAGSKAVPGCLQPCHVPSARISGERIKCRFLGVGGGCVTRKAAVEERWRGGREQAEKLDNFLGSQQACCLPGKQAELVWRLHCVLWELVEA